MYSILDINIKYLLEKYFYNENPLILYNHKAAQLIGAHSLRVCCLFAGYFDLGNIGAFVYRNKQEVHAFIS